MNQNVKITRQQAEEEAKMLEKVFDVVRFLEGDFFEQMQDDPRIGVKIGISQSYISRLEKKIIKRLKREMIKMGCV